MGCAKGVVTAEAWWSGRGNEVKEKIIGEEEEGYGGQIGMGGETKSGKNRWGNKSGRWGIRSGGKYKAVVGGEQNSNG